MSVYQTSTRCTSYNTAWCPSIANIASTQLAAILKAILSKKSQHTANKLFTFGEGCCANKSSQQLFTILLGRSPHLVIPMSTLYLSIYLSIYIYIYIYMSWTCLILISNIDDFYRLCGACVIVSLRSPQTCPACS